MMMWLLLADAQRPGATGSAPPHRGTEWPGTAAMSVRGRSRPAARATSLGCSPGPVNAARSGGVPRRSSKVWCGQEDSNLH